MSHRRFSFDTADALNYKSSTKEIIRVSNEKGRGSVTLLGGGGKEKENYARSIFRPLTFENAKELSNPWLREREKVSQCCTALRPNFQPRGINYSDGCSPFGASNVLACTIRREVRGGRERTRTLSSQFDGYEMFPRVADLHTTDRPRSIHAPRRWNSQSLAGFCPRNQETGRGTTTLRYRSPSSNRGN